MRRYVRFETLRRIYDETKRTRRDKEIDQCSNGKSRRLPKKYSPYTTTAIPTTFDMAYPRSYHDRRTYEVNGNAARPKRKRIPHQLIISRTSLHHMETIVDPSYSDFTPQTKGNLIRMVYALLPKGRTV